VIPAAIARESMVDEEKLIGVFIHGRRIVFEFLIIPSLLYSK
jgi:hypothetical protein